MLKDKFFWANYGMFAAAYATAGAISVAAGASPVGAAAIFLGGMSAYPVAFASGRTASERSPTPSVA
jgi:hypothetical protein